MLSIILEPHWPNWSGISVHIVWSMLVDCPTQLIYIWIFICILGISNLVLVHFGNSRFGPDGWSHHRLLCFITNTKRNTAGLSASWGTWLELNKIFKSHLSLKTFHAGILYEEKKKFPAVKKIIQNSRSYQELNFINEKNSVHRTLISVWARERDWLTRIFASCS